MPLVPQDPQGALAPEPPRDDDDFDARIERRISALKPVVPEDDFDARIDARIRQENGLFRLNRELGRQHDSAKALRIISLARQTGVHPDFVAEDFDAIQEEVRKKDFDPVRFRRESPVTARIIRKSQWYGSLSDVELRTLGNLESLLARPRITWPMSDAEIERRAEREGARRAEEYRQAMQRSGQAVDEEFVKARVHDFNVRQTRDELRAEEAYIASDDEVGFGEAWGRRARENPAWWAPFASSVVDIAKLAQLYSAATAVETGTASDEDEQLLVRFGRLAAADERRGRSVWGHLAGVVQEQPAFWGEFAATAGVYSGVRAAVLKGGKEVAESVLRRAVQKILHSRLAAMTVGATAQTLTGGALRIAEGTIERMLPGIAVAEDDRGRLEAVLVAEGDGFLEALPKGTYDEFVEMFSERTGAAVAGALGRATGLKWLKSAVASRWFKAHPEKTVPDFLAKVGERAGWHGLIEEVLEERVADVMRIPTEGLRVPSGKELAAEAIAFAIPGATAAGFRRLLPRLGQPRPQLETNADTMKRLTELVMSSEMVKTQPDVARELFAEQAAGTPHEFAYVAAESWRQYFQGQKDEKGNPIDPRSMAIAAGVPSKDYDQAVLTGADLQVPMADVLTKIVPKHQTFFQGEMRLNAQDLSVRDAADDAAKRVAAEAAKAEGAARPAAPPASPADLSAAKVGVEIKAALEAAKVAPAVAGPMAVIWERASRAMGQLAGVDPLELLRPYGVKVARETGAEPPPPAAPAAAAPVPAGTTETREVVPQVVPPPPAPAGQPATRPSDIEVPGAAIPIPPGVLAQPQVPQTFGQPPAGDRFERTGDTADDFVTVNGQATFGAIPADVAAAIGWPSAPIVLLVGDKRFGLTKIREKHGADISALGYPSVEAFIADVVRNFDAVYQHDEKTIDLVKRGAPMGLAGISLQRSPRGNYYTVTTAYPTRADVFKDKRPLWERSGPRAPTAEPPPLEVPRGKAGTEIVPPPEGSVKPEGPTTLEQSNRGRTDIGLRFPRSIDIALLPKADLTTFLHETGHFFLEMLGDISEAPNAPEKLKEHYATVLKWLGVERRSELTVEHHEKWALGFEKYLMEGNAPSLALREVFFRMKEWFVAIYRALVNLRVELTDEVRAVMDRLLATEEEIRAASEEQDLRQPLFDDLRADFDAARQEAEEELAGRLMKQYRREQEKTWLEERDRVRAALAEDVDREPVQLALANLTTGKLPDGSPLPEGAPVMKLSRAGVVELAGEVTAAAIPKAAYEKTGGAHPDAIAGILGFASGRQLVDALANAENRDALLDRLADQKMRERHGDLLSDEDLLRQRAVEAVHNGKRAELLRKEIQRLMEKRPAVVREALRRLQRPPIPVEEVERKARGYIAGRNARTLSPDLWRRAEMKAGQEALEAFLKGDVDGAREAKERELMNHELYRAAAAGREESEKILEHLRAQTKPSARERLAKAGREFLGQMDALLERYDLWPWGPRQMEEREKSLREFAAQQQALGFDVEVDLEILAERRKVSWKDLSLNELRGLRQAVDWIKHAAKAQTEELSEEKRRAFEEKRARRNARIAESRRVKVSEKDAFLKTGLDAVKAKLISADGALLPMETLVEMMDGGPLGPWHDDVWNPASKAQSDFLDLMKDVVAKVDGHVEEWRRENPDADLLEAFPNTLPNMPGIPVGGAISRGTLIGIALNMGNESNWDKMLRGHGWENHTQNIKATLRMALTRKDWALVQHIWDDLEVLWPRIEALEEELGRMPIEKVAARGLKVQTRDGFDLTLRGGYFPVSYDRRMSVQGAKEETGPLAGLVDDGYVRATSPRRHTMARTGFAAPLSFDWPSIVQRHVMGVVKDLTYRKFLIETQKIFADSETRKTVQDYFGQEYLDMIVGSAQRPGWLRHVANEHVAVTGLDAWDRMFEWGRTNVAIASLGFKAATAITQLTGYVPAVEYISEHYGQQHFWSALALYYKNLPTNLQSENPDSVLHTILKKSGEMRHRFDTMDRDIYDIQKQIRQGQLGKFKEMVARASMYGIGFMDRLVSAVTWLAGYNGAISKGATEEQAIHAGDAAVRRTQGAGGAKDLSAIQRKRGLWRALTMFLTPFIAAYGRMRQIGAKLAREGVRYFPEAVVRIILVTVFPKLIGELLTGRGPDDDDPKGIGKWIAVKSGASLTAGIPIVRDIGGGIERALEGKPDDIRYSPIFSAIDSLVDVTQRAVDAEQWSDELAWDAFAKSGYVFGLPTDQLAITGEYLLDLLRDEARPEGVGEVLHDLLYRRTGAERRGQQ